MSRTASLVLLAFTIKGVAIFCWSEWARRFTSGLLERLIVAWLVVQLALVAALLLLSLAASITTFAVWVALLLIAAAGAAVTFRRNAVPAGHGQDARAVGLEMTVAGMGVFVVFSFLAYRSFVFSDSTWDAVVYELPRIALWVQHHTLFVYQQTAAANIFANEWNGELNALLYVVASGNELGAAFGNVEVWLLAVVAFGWLCEQFSVPARATLLCGLVLATTPAMLGLAMTVKGDLLAVAAAAAALTFLLAASAQGRAVNWRTAAALAAIGLGSGAKIVLLPLTALLGAALTISWWRTSDRRASLWWLAAGFAATAVFNARYLVNLIQVGSPFARIDETVPGLGTMSRNLVGLFNYVFEVVSSGWNPPRFWALSGGLGGLGIALLLWLALAVVFRSQASTRMSPARNRWQIALFAVAALPPLITIPWQPWSFRYFAPWIMPVAALLLARPFRALPLRWFPLAGVAWSLVIGFNLLYALARPGEHAPMPFAEALRRSPTERIFAAWGGFAVDGAALDGLVFDAPRPLRVLVANQLDSGLMPFFGENHRHAVTLTRAGDPLAAQMARGGWDLVVLSGAHPQESELRELVSRSGYQLRVDHKLWRVFSASTPPPPGP